jgi:large subunit ribosomal protein L10
VNKSVKTEVVAELKEKFESSSAVFATHYRGLTVKELSELRRSLADVGAAYQVCKNTLVKLAIEGGDNAPLSDVLAGPTGIIFVKEDPAAAAKALVDFAKDHDKLELRGGVLGGKFLEPVAITALSKLPSRDEMLGMLLSVFNGSARNFVGVLAAVPRSAVQVLKAIEEKKAA